MHCARCSLISSSLKGSYYRCWAGTETTLKSLTLRTDRLRLKFEIADRVRRQEGQRCSTVEHERGTTRGQVRKPKKHLSRLPERRGTYQQHVHRSETKSRLLNLGFKSPPTRPSSWVGVMSALRPPRMRRPMIIAGALRSGHSLLVHCARGSLTSSSLEGSHYRV